MEKSLSKKQVIFMSFNGEFIHSKETADRSQARAGLLEKGDELDGGSVWEAS